MRKIVIPRPRRPYRLGMAQRSISDIIRFVFCNFGGVDNLGNKYAVLFVQGRAATPARPIGSAWRYEQMNIR